MKNKDFREIQVSSSLLVVIFLGVLALGVFIFLLGVSVGKKQSDLAAPTRIVTQQIPEPAKEDPIKPPASETAARRPEAAAVKPAPKDPPVAEKAAPKTAEKTATPARRGLYYVQVLAVTDRAQAQAVADRYKRQGYTVIVVDPPAGEANYKVRLGGFASRDRATELRNKLNAEAGGRTDFWVVQY